MYSLIFCAFLIFLSACFSASETAIFLLPSYAVNASASFGLRGRALHKLYFSPNFTLPLLLFSNTVVNIILSVLSFRILLSLIGKTEGGTVVIILNILAVTSFLLIFGEFGPKLFAVRRPRQVAFALSPFVYFLGFVLYPLIKPLEFFLESVLKDKKGEILSASEVLYLLHNAKNSQSTHESAKWKLTYSLLSLGITVAEDVMKKRRNIPCIDSSSQWREAESVFKGTGSKTLLVYDENLDNVAGTLSLSKCIAEGAESGRTLKSLVDPAFFIPTSAKLSSVLNNLRRTGDIFLVVKDEYGQTQGIVTEDDILDYLFGKENISKGDGKIPSGQKKAKFSGDATLRQISQAMNFYVDPSIADKSAGKFLLENLKRIPKKNDVVLLCDSKLRVEKVKKNQVTEISVEKEL